MPYSIHLYIGASGAGKDYLAKQHLEGWGLDPDQHIIKFAAPGKRLFERIYNLPQGTMDDRSYRIKTVPGGDTTYLERFIYWFRYQEQIFPPHYFINETLDALGSSDCQTIAVTDCRTLYELAALVEFAALECAEIVPYYVVSDKQQRLESDCNLEAILVELQRLRARWLKTTEHPRIQLTTLIVNER